MKLAEVLRPVSRPVAVASTTDYRLLGVRLDGRGAFLRETVTGSEVSAKTLFRVAAGDFIYSRLFAWRGAFGLISDELNGSYVSGEFPVFEGLEDRLDGRFLNYWFRLPKTLDRVSRDCTGSTPLTRNRFKEQFFLALDVALPPLAEQRRIVVRIEELATKIEEARRLRNSLTQETPALVQAHLNRVFGDPYRGAEGRFGIASFRPLSDVVDDVADGPHVTPTYVELGIPFVTAQSITSGHVDLSNTKHITAEDHRQFQRRARAEKGDVLITKDGTIGIPCFVDTDEGFSFFVSVALVKPRRGIMDGRFLTWALRAPYLQQRMREHSKGDMIRHLVLREIRQLLVPVTPHLEQRRIVEELDVLQAELDTLKRLQAETAAELDALLPSILDRAFKGEL